MLFSYNQVVTLGTGSCPGFAPTSIIYQLHSPSHLHKRPLISSQVVHVFPSSPCFRLNVSHFPCWWMWTQCWQCIHYTICLHWHWLSVSYESIKRKVASSLLPKAHAIWSHCNFFGFEWKFVKILMKGSCAIPLSKGFSKNDQGNKKYWLEQHISIF